MEQHNQKLLALEELFNSEGWEVLKENIQVVYDNADNVLHSITCPNREIYVGKCEAVKEILSIEAKAREEIEVSKVHNE